MNYHIDIQHASKESIPVTDEQITAWVIHTLKKFKPQAELTLRIVDTEEMVYLNSTYRQKNKPTNVLSFPTTLPNEIELDYPLLGDIILCPSVLAAESQEYGQPLQARWAHIIIHGVLHLLGYDHVLAEDEHIMQSIEIELLSNLGFTNPYYIEDSEIE